MDIGSLERIVTIVDATVAPYGWRHPHLLVKVEGGDVSLRDLPADVHPVEHLLGFVAPPAWDAIGLVTYGWAAPADTRLRPSRHACRRRVRCTAVVDRDGHEAATAALDDGTVIDEPGEGRAGDVLRRCLGVPTPPPPPLRLLSDVLWLESVLAEEPASWEAVEALRPDTGAGGRAATSWTRLRLLAAADGAWGALAAWMDDGMFARWLLAERPALAELLDRCDERLPPALARRLRGSVG